MRITPRTGFLATLLAALLSSGAIALSARAAQETWILNGTSNIGGYSTAVTGSPVSITTPFGPGLRFDGDDRLIVNANPVAGATAYTIEMLFRPDNYTIANNNQPRILHIQSATPPDHRATLEARIGTDNQWYLDAFIKTDNNHTLAPTTKLHPTNRWYSYAMTYDGTTQRAYVNGVLDDSFVIALAPFVTAQTSLGMRFNGVNPFSGDISTVRFTTSALAPADLLTARIPGDYDGNYYSPGGGVDANDLAVWQSQYGSAGGPFPQVGANADGNLDGVVDGKDFMLWQSRLGATPANPAQAVPEPPTLTSMLMAGLAIACSRRFCFF